MKDVDSINIGQLLDRTTDAINCPMGFVLYVAAMVLAAFLIH